MMVFLCAPLHHFFRHVCHNLFYPPEVVKNKTLHSKHLNVNMLQLCEGFSLIHETLPTDVLFLVVPRLHPQVHIHCV